MDSRAFARRSAFGLTLVLFLGLLVPGTALGSTEQRVEDARERVRESERRIEATQGELESARRDVAEIDGRISAAEDELAAIEVRLAELDGELRIASEELAWAEEVHEEASQREREATDRAEATLRELEAAIQEQSDNQAMVESLARDTFKHGMTQTSPALAAFEMVDSGSIEGVADRLHYLQRWMGERTSALEGAEALVVKVDTLAERAQVEAAYRQQALEIAEAARVEAEEAHARVEALVQEVTVQLERQDQVVRELEEHRKAAAARVGELEDQVERERLERERRERAAKEEARRLQERREREERERARAAAAAGGGVRSGPRPGLVTVGGITVAASIGPNLERLLNDARAAGIVLGGSGYRSNESQIRLRTINGCPDVYNSPSSSCRVPTARPGQSMHEQGLAIDFTYQGSTICFPRPGSQCRGNPAYDWLRANASKYGFHNLPSEAWHWSTNGR